MSKRGLAGLPGKLRRPLRRNRSRTLIASVVILIGLMIVLVWITDSRLWDLIAGIGTIVGLVTGFVQLRGTLKKINPNPIRVRYTLRTTWIEGVVQNFDPSKSLDHYVDEKAIVHAHAFLIIDIVSQATDEAIKLAPYLLIEVSEVEPIPQTVDYIFPYRGGAGGLNKVFLATFSPERDKVFGAPQLADVAEVPYRQETFDFFTLTPGEGETFQLNYSVLPGYYYRFRVGVQYSYQGKDDVHWSEEEYVAGIPIDSSTVRVWRYIPTAAPSLANSFEKIPFDSPARSTGIPNIDEGLIARNVRVQEQAVKQYRSSFTLPQPR